MGCKTNFMNFTDILLNNTGSSKDSFLNELIYDKFTSLIMIILDTEVVKFSLAAILRKSRHEN